MNSTQTSTPASLKAQTSTPASLKAQTSAPFTVAKAPVRARNPKAARLLARAQAEFQAKTQAKSLAASQGSNTENKPSKTLLTSASLNTLMNFLLKALNEWAAEKPGEVGSRPTWAQNQIELVQDICASICEDLRSVLTERPMCGAIKALGCRDNGCAWFHDLSTERARKSKNKNAKPLKVGEATCSQLLKQISYRFERGQERMKNAQNCDFDVYLFQQFEARAKFFAGMIKEQGQQQNLVNAFRLNPVAIAPVPEAKVETKDEAATPAPIMISADLAKPIVEGMSYARIVNPNAVGSTETSVNGEPTVTKPSKTHTRAKRQAQAKAAREAREANQKVAPKKAPVAKAPASVKAPAAPEPKKVPVSKVTAPAETPTATPAPTTSPSAPPAAAQLLPLRLALMPRARATNSSASDELLQVFICPRGDGVPKAIRISRSDYEQIFAQVAKS